MSEEDVEEGGMGAAAEKEVEVQEVPSHHVHAEVDSSDDEVRGRGRGRGNPSPSPSPSPNPHPNQEIASSSSVAYGDYLQVRYRADEHCKPERHYLLKVRATRSLSPPLTLTLTPLTLTLTFSRGGRPRSSPRSYPPMRPRRRTAS